jgi:hypothetical protein
VSSQVELAAGMVAAARSETPPPTETSGAVLSPSAGSDMSHHDRSKVRRKHPNISPALNTTGASVLDAARATASIAVSDELKARLRGQDP